MFSIYKLGSNSLWEIESTDPLSGGPLSWTSSIRLRHLCTGKYIYLSSESDSEKKFNESLRRLSKPEENSNDFDISIIVEELQDSQISRAHEVQNSYEITGKYKSELTSTDLLLTELALHPTTVIDKREQVPRECILRIESQYSQTWLHVSGADLVSTSTEMTKKRSFLGAGREKEYSLVRRNSGLLVEDTSRGIIVRAVKGSRDQDAFRIIPASLVRFSLFSPPPFSFLETFSRDHFCQ